MNSNLRTGAGTRNTLSGRGQVILAALSAVIILTVAVTVFMVSVPAVSLAGGNNVDRLAASQPQEAPYPAGFEQAHSGSVAASPAGKEASYADIIEARRKASGEPACNLECEYIHQQQELDMCEGLCGR